MQLGKLEKIDDLRKIWPYDYDFKCYKHRSVVA